MRKGRWVGIAAGITVVALLAMAWMRAPKTIGYEIIELTWLDGYSNLDDLHINDRGVVAGKLVKCRDGSDHLFVWDLDNGLKDLGKPDGMSPKDSIKIFDFNNKSQILALNLSSNVYEDPNTSFFGAYFYDPRMGFRKIDNPPGFRGFYCNKMNDRGQVVGTASRNLPGEQSPYWIFLWEPETGPRALNLSGMAVDINNSGHILGMDGDALFLWSPEEGRRVFEEFPYGPVLHLQLSDSDEIFGIADSFDEYSKTYRIFRWNRSQGYQEFHTCEKEDEVDEFTVLAMNDQRVLYYQMCTPFTWFGLFGHKDPEPEPRLYTVGEGLSFPRNLPLYAAYRSTYWHINHNGWIVGTMYDRTYVMIPKGKAEKKKE